MGVHTSTPEVVSHNNDTAHKPAQTLSPRDTSFSNLNDPAPTRDPESTLTTALDD